MLELSGPVHLHRFERSEVTWVIPCHIISYHILQVHVHTARNSLESTALAVTTTLRKFRDVALTSTASFQYDGA
jgi:hypothetical protein